MRTRQQAADAERGITQYSETVAEYEARLRKAEREHEARYHREVESSKRSRIEKDHLHSLYAGMPPAKRRELEPVMEPCSIRRCSCKGRGHEVYADDTWTA